MELVSMGSMLDLVNDMTDMVAGERKAIIAWLRAHADQHDRAIAAGACVCGSGMHGELRDQAAYYLQVADALEGGADTAWRYGFPREDWLLPAQAGVTRMGGDCQP